MKKYLFSTAQRGGKPHKIFLQGLEKLSNDKSEIYILPTNGKRAAILDAEQTAKEDREVLNYNFRNNYNVLEKKLTLNSNLYYPDLRVKAQQMVPYTSMERFTKNGKSFLIASPKQMLKVQPWSAEKLPRMIWSTGACTHPNYRRNAWGDKATKDHQYGAINIDIIDNKLFNIRPISANKNGTFYDLGIRYNGTDKPKKERAEFICAEIHTHPSTMDKECIGGFKRMIQDLNPKKLVLHDFFDGKSVSYWDDRDPIASAKRMRDGNADLEKEVKYCSDFLKELKDVGQKDMEVAIVRSNHDERMDMFLRTGRYISDPLNLVFASKLIEPLYEGKMGLQTAMELVGGKIDGVKYLTRSEDYRIQGIQLGIHGDKGTKGSRNTSIRAIEKFAPRSITGHKHTPEVFRDVTVIGGLFSARGYNTGPQCNIPSVAVGYRNKKSQLVNIINGKYK